MAHYADAVADMESRSEREDPTSWLYQAAMHGTRDPNPLPAWNKCTHGSWFFVAWHRMFVWYFEEIVRASIRRLHGDEAAEAWALPYWNYCRGGEFASIPDAFRSPTVNGDTNPLYVEARAPGINDGGQLEDEITESTKALARPNFIGIAEFGGGEGPADQQFWEAGGVFEETPHGSVHVGVGGWMGKIKTAAKDPIFWLHHCNIDRIWSQWISQPNRENPPQPEWEGQEFEFFNIQGQPASKASKAVVDTTVLGYKYDSVDGIPSGPPPATPPSPQPPPEQEAAVSASAEPPVSGPKFVAATEETVTLTGEPEAIPVEINEQAQAEVREASRKSDPRHLYLNIEDVEGETNPGTVYGIYVNLPKKDPDREEKARHHVGNVSFFGIEHSREPLKDEHGHSFRVSVEVGELLRALGGGEHYDEEKLTVSFLPLGLIPAEGAEEAASAAGEQAEQAPIHIGRVSLSIDA